jgi:hypothetical protein
MPDHRAGVSPPLLFSGRKKLWVSHVATAEYAAMFSRRCHHPYCSQLEKAVEVCLGRPTKSTRRTISHAFVLYRELVTELSHDDLDNKVTDRIALICPSLPPTDN